jgi:hypothetical protein
MAIIHNNLWKLLNDISAKNYKGFPPSESTSSMNPVINAKSII